MKVQSTDRIGRILKLKCEHEIETDKKDTQNYLTNGCNHEALQIPDDYKFAIVISFLSNSELSILLERSRILISQMNFGLS